MTAVLLTGSRAPATLELARRFADEGAFVVVADSQPALTSRSSAVGAAYRVPSARFRPREFAVAIEGIARRHDVDLVVPCCEEIFWLAGSSERLGGRLFAPPLPVLRRLHDKAEFAALLTELDIAHPETEVVASPFAWRRRSAVRRRSPDGPLIAKPAFSRFGGETITIPAGSGLPSLPRVDAEQRWLLQEFVTGEEFCTYAVAVAGSLTAFVTYRPVARAGRGAGVAFARLDDADPLSVQARGIAATLASALSLTGHFGLDLMHSAAGLQVLECNPRATSGVHLFAPGDGLAGAFSGRPAGSPSRAGARLGLPHLMYAPRSIRSFGQLGEAARQMRSPDVLSQPGDRIPFPVLLRSLAVQSSVAARNGVSLLAASTLDIEWNGEPMPPVAATGVLHPPPEAAEGRLLEEQDRSDWPRRLAAEIDDAGGLSALVENLGCDFGTVRIGGLDLPMTRPASAPGPQPTVGQVRGGTPEFSPMRDLKQASAHASEPDSYVSSPISHYVHYAREELAVLESPVWRAVGAAVVGLLGRVLRAGRADDILLLGNAPVSTNLLPDLPERAIAAATARMNRDHPALAVGWRSVHARGGIRPEVLRRCGYRLIPSRSVLFTETRGSEWERPRDTARDAAILRSSGYRVREAPVDPATGVSPYAVRVRLAELYSMLYVQKYSRLNPRYTERFVEAAQRSGLLRFTVLERDGRIDGVVGTIVAHSFLAAPFVGYDTALPQETGLYRMLSYLVARQAHEAGVRLHGSSGVADFKRNRGAEPETEFLAVYAKHLTPGRRFTWWLLEQIVRRIALPLVRRQGL
ncbi:GNAT family N-acetyltransferase [Herbiconiux sp.]|uniref:GNAT family N-acetyltransferase n=1 Tax=Herbiconiux sp. TaxID=1871186 RepID=UPI0025C17BE3|nr:GNAT family N-acetyltransferase [Herbiconiux sp.]